MPKTTKTEEMPQAAAPGRETRGSRAMETGEPAARASREPRASRASTPPATPPGTAPAAGRDDAPAARAAGRADASPSPEEIAQRAYEIYQQRGGGDGQEVDDWVRAEQELREGRGRRQNET
jgi:hypothetical protein